MRRCHDSSGRGRHLREVMMRNGRTAPESQVRARHRQTLHPNGNGSRSEPDTIDTRQLLAVLTAFRKGNFAVRLPVEWTGVAGKISDAVNDVIELNQRLAKELERLSKIVGKEGK